MTDGDGRRSPAARDTHRARRRPRRRGPLGCLAWLLLAGVLALPAWVAWNLLPVADTPRPGDFEVEAGWGGAQVAAALAEEGYVRDARVFTLWLRLRGLDRSIGEGLYELSPHLSVPVVAQRLAAGGRARAQRLTVPEGLTAAAVAERFAALRGDARATAVAAAGGNADPATEARARFEALVREPGALAPPYLPGDAGLEGYLYPDTYQLGLEADAKDAIAAMVRRFEQELDVEVRRALGRAGLSVHAWVTLASLVQAEAAHDGEMPLIAGVFRNRLDRGMALQSDPTVAYGLDKPLPELSAVDGDLQRDHPWNTYTRGGLPAGPIGNPGRAALRAVLEPERRSPEGESWLYFLHGRDGDGEAVFRPNTTLPEHNADVDRFLR